MKSPHRRVLPLFTTAAVLLFLTPSQTTNASQHNSLMCVSADGKLIATSNRDSATVSVFNSVGLQRQFEFKVGQHPEGTTFIGQSRLVACCVYAEDCVVILNAETKEIVQRIDVFDEPYGVVSSTDGKYLFVTLEYPGQVIRINTADWTVDATWNVGQMLRGIALAPDQQHLFVTEYLTTKIIQLNADTGDIVAELPGASTDNIARQIALHPTLPKAFVPHIRSKVSAAHGNGSIFPYVGVATFAGEFSGKRMRIPMDSFRGTRVVANPWEVAISPDGTLAFVLFGATNDLFVAKVEGDDYKELTHVATMQLGNNPRAVRVTPDGQTLLIYNALDYELVSYSIPQLQEIDRTTVTDFPLPDEHLLGKKLFYTARQPMSGRQWIACSSCHIDGDADGRTWQNPEGLRQTQPLKGIAWTHPIHWSADRDEVQDFEHTIRGLLMQGRGLLKGKLPDAMSDSIQGRSRALDALALYTNSHRFSLSPHAKAGLSESAQRGQSIFHSSATKCATCHSGAFYSDSQPAKDVIRYHVGTGTNDKSELMGTAYDTPTLLGVYRSAPYLHDGTAATLRDVLTSQNQSDQHGKTSQLNDSEIDDLVEFLKALPFEDPEPDARASGLKRVGTKPGDSDLR